MKKIMEGKKRAEQVVAQISQRLGNLGDVRAVSTRLGRGIRKGINILDSVRLESELSNKVNDGPVAVTFKGHRIALVAPNQGRRSPWVMFAGCSY